MSLLSAYKHETKKHPICGMTLVELVIAIPLASGIALMAFYAVRSSMQVATQLNRTMDECNALRSGWMLAMLDTDAWESHASPEFPYLKGHLSAEIPDNNGDLIVNKRPFRPMSLRFQPGQLADSTALHPHQKSSWYVGPIISGTHPTFLSCVKRSDVVDKIREASPYFYDRDPTTTPITRRADQRRFPGAIDGGPIVLPAGWEPWHLHGDFCSISNINRDVWNESGSQMTMLRVYGKLGHMGILGYLPTGTIVYPVTPPTNRSEGNIGVASKRWCWGEVPWALNTSSSFIDPARGVPKPADLSSMGLPATPNLFNFIFGMPRPNNVFGLWAPDNTLSGLIPFTEYTPFYTIGLPFIPCDYQSALRREANNVLIGGVYPARVLFDPTREEANSDAIPPRGMREANTWDSMRYLDSFAMYGFRMISEVPRKFTIGQGYDYRTAVSSYWLDRYAVTTHFSPGASSDPAVQRTALDHGRQTSLRIARYNGIGYDRIRINLRTAAAKERGFDIEITPYGTSYRGARWLWGLRTNGVIGDSWGAP